ncbi:protein-L-isoaspartate O-methyltransferase [uncultured Cellulomonas sp.]|uniref:protein-L-isoaspartate O-methyltransferase family protein n=1 Tax=uncultured Cellulomonas sp. TaxID=189682 RepID=UPI002608959F|nr:protein-L-isoaspartate O-methyltransferase [uncultured Cellulomonas sp.]
MTGAAQPDDVAAAMASLDRRAFLPPDQHAHAHEDRPLPIGLGQTCSQPATVAAMLRLLDVRPGARVLDVGAGSGWTTAILARLVGPHGSVLGVELEPELADRAARSLAGCGTPWAQVLPAQPGVLGWPRPGGYDRILCSASPSALPDALVDQLADGGRLVIPVGEEMWLVVRDGDRVRRSTHGRYRFVPLRGRPGGT